MAEETKTETAAEAPAKAAETVAKAAADTAVKATKTAARRRKAAKAPRAKAARIAKAPRAAKANRAAGAKRAAATRKYNRVVRDSARVAEQGIEMTRNNYFNAFETLPTFAPFQSMLDQANERGQDYARKSQKVAEQLADLTRANVEAIVEAGRVAAEGARSIGQELVAKGRDGVEEASDAIRSLAEAKSPTEYMQLQGEFVRAQFDRMVQDSSKLTETMVKLAGEAFQPLQNRAAANAQRFNTLVA